MRAYTGISRATIEINDESKREEIIKIVEDDFLNENYKYKDTFKIGEGIYEGNCGTIEIGGATVLHKINEKGLLPYLDKYLITKYINDGTTEESDFLAQCIEDNKEKKMLKNQYSVSRNFLF
ncbi:MAG: hypothetical protein Q4F88_06040 [Eubacteriales bacterium]|nr:hypothetical protein [Eubacteriales bacterium]